MEHTNPPDVALLRPPHRLSWRFHWRADTILPIPVRPTG